MTDVNSQRSITISVHRQDNGVSYRCLASNAATDGAIEAVTQLNVQCEFGYNKND